MHASNYKSWTLFWQILSYWRVCAEALSLAPADVFIDTLGVGFAYPLVKLVFGVPVFSYTHYPTVSTDMVANIASNQFNNSVANSAV